MSKELRQSWSHEKLTFDHAPKSKPQDLRDEGKRKPPAAQQSAKVQQAVEPQIRTLSKKNVGGEKDKDSDKNLRGRGCTDVAGFTDSGGKTCHDYSAKDLCTIFKLVQVVACVEFNLQMTRSCVVCGSRNDQLLLWDRSFGSFASWVRDHGIAWATRQQQQCDYLWFIVRFFYSQATPGATGYSSHASQCSHKNLFDGLCW